MANIGYARVSSREQHLDMQLTALRDKGCQTIFQEKVSGIRQRPELEKCLSFPDFVIASPKNSHQIV